MTDVVSFEQSANCIHIININNNTADIIRTGDIRCDTGSSTERSDAAFDKNNKFDNASINIYRYKFTEDFTNELFKFSKIHQYDHRKDFKEAWNVWFEENNEIVNDEIRRLTNLGYDGDVQDKMFKSARYYFRKKSTEKKAPTERRVYVGVQKGLLDAMDEHILFKIDSKKCKPSESFDDFCKNNIDLLKEEVSILCRNGNINSAEIKQKIKKTYKNRYFLLANK
jgi:hypothetical protein